MEITINWMQILQVFGVLGGIATMFGFFLAPMLYLGAKIDAMRQEMHVESKDFHARLALQDQEFKIRMCALEENYLKNKRN